MKRISRLLPIIILLTVVFAMVPSDTFAALAKPKKPKITKVLVSDQKASSVKITVKYGKVKNAKSYTLYKVSSKTQWKYWKKIKASQKKKYSNKKKYKLVKSGKKYKVYKKKTVKSYKKIAASKKLSMSFTAKYDTNYKLAVRAFNGKKAGAYSDVKSCKPKRPTPNYNGYETYVFFGSDSRANDESWKSPDGGKNTEDTSGTEGTPRSDVIMLINVNRSTQIIDITSVYRDTAINKDVNSVNFQKANKAFADYGPKEACKVLEKNLDIKIKGYASANFKGVADMIDSLGGVTVSGLTAKTDEAHKEKYNVSDVIDVVNGIYIPEMNRIYGLPEDSNMIEKGQDTQTLNGLQAVAYARVRYTEGWDMQRSVRQRDVLKQMIEKYKKYDGNKIELITNLSSGIDVRFTDDDADASAIKRVAKLADLIYVIQNYTVRSQGFPFYKQSYNKQYIKKTTEENLGKSALYPPCDLKNNVTRLHQLVYGEAWYSPNQTVINFSNALEKESEFTFDGREKSYNYKY